MKTIKNIFLLVLFGTTSFLSWSMESDSRSLFLDPNLIKIKGYKKPGPSSRSEVSSIPKVELDKQESKKLLSQDQAEIRSNNSSVSSSQCRLGLQSACEPVNSLLIPRIDRQWRLLYKKQLDECFEIVFAPSFSSIETNTKFCSRYNDQAMYVILSELIIKAQTQDIKLADIFCLLVKTLMTRRDYKLNYEALSFIYEHIPAFHTIFICFEAIKHIPVQQLSVLSAVYNLKPCDKLLISYDPKFEEQYILLRDQLVFLYYLHFLLTQKKRIEADYKYINEVYKDLEINNNIINEIKKHNASISCCPCVIL